MPVNTLLQKAQRFEIQKYKRPRDEKHLRQTHVPFSGAPYQHPHDSSRLLLVPDPFSTSPYYLEFATADIAFADELPSIVNMNEETVSMVRLWVKRGSVAVHCTPFVVEHLSTGSLH